MDETAHPNERNRPATGSADRGAGGESPSPLVAAEFDRLSQLFVDALGDDAIAVDALIGARQMMEDHVAATGAASWFVAPPLAPEQQDAFELLWLQLLDRLRASARLRVIVPDETLVRLCMAVVTGDAAAAGHEPLRLLQLATVPGRVIWAILNARDTEALRNAIAPGQVWVRADLLGSDEWPLVRAAAANSVRVAGLGRPSGRPEGSPTSALAPVIAAVVANPELTNAEIAELARDVWTRLGFADDYSSVRKRIARIRKAADRTKNT